MGDDFLTQLRRSAASSAGVSSQPPSPLPPKEEYIAFEAKSRTEFLNVLLTKPPHHSPKNQYILNVVHDGALGTEFLITYTFMNISVHGRNLKEVVFAIQHSMAVYIQEYDPERWPKPKDDKAPFIESIVVRLHEDTLGISSAGETRQ